MIVNVVVSPAWTRFAGIGPMQHSESPNFFDTLAYVDFNHDLINNKRKGNIALTSKPSTTHKSSRTVWAELEGLHTSQNHEIQEKRYYSLWNFGEIVFQSQWFKNSMHSTKDIRDATTPQQASTRELGSGARLGRLDSSRHTRSAPV